MKVVITVTKIDERQYEVQVEDDVAVTNIKTTSPQRTILNTLTSLGIKGTRGPKPGISPKP